MQEVWQLRHGVAPRCPDVVVFPGCHADVERVMAAAVANDVCLIPFGGGTRYAGVAAPPPTSCHFGVRADCRSVAP